VESSLEREGIEETSDAVLLDRLCMMSVEDHMVHRLYPALEARGLHSCVIVVATCSVPSFACFLSLGIEKSKPARMTRPSHEWEVGVDATGNEELFGTSSVVQGVPDPHENAREKREGIGGGEGGERKRKGRGWVQRDVG